MKSLHHDKVILISLVSILLLGAVLRIWNLAGQDMVGDDALYSLRALGYVDYVASENKQSTPVTWFEEQQWWQSLSFHDTPPLVFLVQWLFFRIGGDSFWTARLPFALAGLLSVFAVFLLGSVLFGKRVGIAAMASLAIMNYHVWISRIGLLESFVILWSIFALYFFVKAEKNQVNYIWWAVFCAAGFLTKYTFIFIAPVFVVPLLLWRRNIWKEKWIYASIAVFFVLLSPVIIYNFMVYQTRGHFDVGLSEMTGIHSEDFSGQIRQVAGGSLSILSFPKAIIDATKTIARNLSIGFSALLLVCFILLIYLTKKNKKYYFIWLGFFGVVFATMLMGADQKYIVMIAPFLSLTVGSAIIWLYEQFKNKRYLRAVLIIFIAFIGSCEIVKTGQEQWSMKNQRGYNALESYVEKFYQEFPDPSYIIFSKTPQIFNYQIGIVQSIYDKGEDKPQQKHLLVYDDRMGWFPAVWIFERRLLYNVSAIPSLSQFISGIEKNGVNNFTQYGFEDATIIVAKAELLTNAKYLEEESLKNFVDQLASEQEPIEEILNPSGEIAFQVYRLSLID